MLHYPGTAERVIYILSAKGLNLTPPHNNNKNNNE